ncbi:CDF family Co(II)/Ni(II) efflux transporter DmeF [Dyella sp.]|jgi:cation diffusion facilitator family transporter|uniref:CDF family Co(II)/Ni(II) efflux transporter DmeF n=1 Tax=Dyella sp. TaxID=1869338 RepID=UPI002D783A6F|nr:CDF family Co(II)/Ni(II) efflux transporter DmeF [Dyella sp.]HET6430949.1 CDF family Co(II)/Ni(II) efflux transporter DmeF [Dyella sp.]
MITPDPAPHAHDHAFHDGNAVGERNTRRVVAITLVMMVVEIAGGYTLNSMALLADGWHMSSHALALGLSLAAYALARRLSGDRRFAFGTWKIEVLAGYTSALGLIVVAVLMLVQSVERLLTPGAIHYDEAIAIAALGLAVNLLCAWLLEDGHHGHDHGHGHDHHGHDHHSHAHGDHHHDINLRSAYLHVIADAATSLLAIAALIGGKYFGAAWLDPLMGMLGAVLVTRWAVGLMRQSARVLLDAEMDAPVVAEIREVVDQALPATAISDLHVWRVGKGRYACILALVSNAPLSAHEVRHRLSVHEELVHVTVEINPA